MKYLRPSTALPRNTVDVFRQVDDQLQKLGSRSLKAVIRLVSRVGSDSFWDVKVSDCEGRPAEGAIILAWMCESGQYVSSTTNQWMGVIAESPDGFYIIGNHQDPANYVKSQTVRLPREGGRFKIANNPNATLKVCVLGMEQGE